MTGEVDSSLYRNMKSQPDTIGEIETPAALVETSTVTRNLDRMSAYASAHGLRLRPHVKTHKTTVIGAEQVKRGAVGLTCATPREMEVMSAAASDLLLAHPPLGGKIQRLIGLPSTVRIVTALDSVEAIEHVADAASAAGRSIRVYVELDVGMHRVGVATAADAVALARHVAESASLEYAGICFYPGHIREPLDAQSSKIAELNARLEEIVHALERAGLAPPAVSGGSTPTSWRTHEMPLVTEFRPGTYVFNDRTTAAIGACASEDCALTVLATVVSTSVSGQAVVDAGSKALGREPMRGASAEGYGAVAGHDALVVSALSEEHGTLDLSKTSWRPRVGDRIRIVPNHACIVVHLNDCLYAVDGEVVEGIWPVAARGRTRPSAAASTTAS